MTLSLVRPAAASALILPLLAACAGSSGTGTNGPDGDPVYGGTLVVGVTGDVTSLNPYDGAGETTSMVVAQVNASLFKRYEGEVMPALAESIERSADEMTATITLRDGLEFSNGEPITSEDVVFSLDQATQGAVGGTLYQDILESQRVEGENQVVLELVRPSINLEAVLSYAGASIIPADFGGLTEDAFFEEPVGAGPFAFESRRPGTSLSLSKNENFWDGDKPYFDGVEFQVFTSVNALTSAFQAGDVQAVPFAPRESVPSFAGANVVSTAAASTEMMFINGRTGPTSELEVRRAISTAIDRTTIVEQLGGSGDEPSATYLPATVLGEAEPAPVEARDSAAAEALLAETTYADGVTIELIYPTGDATLANTVQAIQQNVAEAGITLDPQALDIGAFVDRLLSGDYELAYQSISDPGNTAEASLAFFISSEGIGGGWSTQVAEDALREYQDATDPAEQAAALDTFQDWVSAEVPVIPTVSVSPALVLDNRIGGFDGMRQVTQQNAPLEELWLAP